MSISFGFSFLKWGISYKFFYMDRLSFPNALNVNRLLVKVNRLTGLHPVCKLWPTNYCHRVPMLPAHDRNTFFIESMCTVAGLRPESVHTLWFRVVRVGTRSIPSRPSLAWSECLAMLPLTLNHKRDDEHWEVYVDLHAAGASVTPQDIYSSDGSDLPTN